MRLSVFFVCVSIFFFHQIVFGEENYFANSSPWQPVAGLHYRLITPDLPQQQSINFYFWAGSESCYQLEDALQNWQRLHPEVKITRIPIVKRPHWRLLAKAWLVAQIMGNKDVFLNELYHSIHGKSQNITNYEELEQFVISMAIDPLDFKAHFNSLIINQQLKTIQNQALMLPVPGVPAIIINNRWYTDASTGVTASQLITVIDLLFEEDPNKDVNTET